jgi:hypothetical protein
VAESGLSNRRRPEVDAYQLSITTGSNPVLTTMISYYYNADACVMKYLTVGKTTKSGGGWVDAEVREYSNTRKVAIARYVLR